MKEIMKKTQDLCKKTTMEITCIIKKLDNNIKYILIMVPVLASYIGLIKSLIKLAFKPEDYKTPNRVKATPKNVAKGYCIGIVGSLYYGLMSIAAEKVANLGEDKKEDVNDEQ